MTAKRANGNDHDNDPNLPAPPCYVTDEEATARVDKARENFTKWIPMLVTAGIAVVSNAVFVAYSYGRMEARINPVEARLVDLTHEKLSVAFVTRPEFGTRTTQRDREMATQADWIRREFSENQEWMKRLEAKIDRLLERQTARE
jgi:hypothetical protein